MGVRLAPFDKQQQPPRSISTLISSDRCTSINQNPRYPRVYPSLSLSSSPSFPSFPSSPPLALSLSLSRHVDRSARRAYRGNFRPRERAWRLSTTRRTALRDFAAQTRNKLHLKSAFGVRRSSLRGAAEFRLFSSAPVSHPVYVRSLLSPAIVSFRKPPPSQIAEYSRLIRAIQTRARSRFLSSVRAASGLFPKFVINLFGMRATRGWPGFARRPSSCLDSR